MKSIMQSEKKCYLTGSPVNLHRHHIFEGSGKRELSERYGLWVWLRSELHNGSGEGVHFNKPLELRLKREAQEQAMQYYGWTVERFIKIFGRSYL